ncbi:MAG UNVERIFIED_CONTAM: AMP-binding protein, partial [Thermobifida fusca]
MREYTTPAVKELDPDTRLTDTVFTRAAQEPNAVMFRRLVDGAWRDVTCAEFPRDVMGVAKALIAAGINHGDRVALMSRTRYEWTVIDYAIWTIGGVTVPIFDTSSEEQVEWILRDSGSTLAFVENDEHAERVRAVSAQLLEPDRIVQIESDSFPAFVATGADVADSVVEERRAATGLDDLATLIYTSGTTGRPKGCELTQRNLAFDVMSVNSGPMKDVFTMEGRSTLLFLPLAHSLARIIQVGCVETKTVMGHFPSTGPDLLDALASFRPMFLLAVPRVFEKVYNKAEQKA